MAARISWVRTIGTTVLQRTDLAQRMTELEEENGRLRGELQRCSEVEREAAFCREAAGIVSRPAGNMQEAGIFSYNTASGIRQAIISRGAGDGVSAGDVVMTSRGELVGVVRSVYESHATVYRIQDVAFEVTARVDGSDVAGLVRADGEGSLMLDLVQNDETVSEGAKVVTSGDDGYPAGLLIGIVRSVNNTAATLFQYVRIEPSVPDGVHGSVLVIRP
jgi:cell shape-determining protein MreC